MRYVCTYCMYIQWSMDVRTVLGKYITQTSKLLLVCLATGSCSGAVDDAPVAGRRGRQETTPCGRKGVASGRADWETGSTGSTGKIACAPAPALVFFRLTAGQVVCKCQIETRTGAAIGRANGHGSVDGERAQRWARTTPPSAWTGWLDATAAGRPFLRPVTLAKSVIRRHDL